ncbi:deoxyribodipyrimidine photo-lyase [Kocuria coralli]|uniref:Deoxyribodipyrimidine photo-lyase n=1 Tax=Kocuria coralli TaxID=1461025 RepID=A0A5J5KX61_9MICC|nr:deoxyribodipyrimidine photo-lyase [Kocuria coralli]KAA9394357.1 deoxyribodipyrimidine photo-lyase [Kocuria coralli]
MTSLAVIGSNLRLDDNPALLHAAQDGPAVVLYCEDTNVRVPGAAYTWWTNKSLELLRADLEDHGLPLVAVRGPLPEVIREIVGALGITHVHANRRWGENALEVDRQWAGALRETGVEIDGYTAHVLHDPWSLTTGQGGPYRVYTPFSRRFDGWDCEPFDLPERRERDEELFGRVAELELGARVSHLGGTDEPRWARKFSWEVGEKAAAERLEDFLDGAIEDYAGDRDLPGTAGTSVLSPHLAHGEIGPRRVFQLVDRHLRAQPSESAKAFRQELLWREFNHHLLYHYPDMPSTNLNPRFDSFPWKETDSAEPLIEAWRSGHTGLPMIDAGMRQLWQTGWMHNRVRMAVASILTKNVGVHWTVGEQWFWDTLVDADPASNPGNWQWASGTGADAAPYFRIFNPRRQAERFDPEAHYIHEWVPELAGTPAKEVLAAHNREASAPAGRAGRRAETLEHYPPPMVDLKASRAAALDAYQETA